MTNTPDRIVTRPDFDGIVCAVLIQDAEGITGKICWLEPGEIQSGQAEIQKGDILANLPYSPDCILWFDHHISNKPGKEIKGAFEVAPSAAGVVYRYYQNRGMLDNRYDELIFHTDIIDAALLNKNQVQYPEKYPYILLSMTIKNEDYADIDYWNLLVELLKKNTIDQIMEHPEVEKRSRIVIEENSQWEAHLKEHTIVKDKISITDFRGLDKVPTGNRFLSYCIFPESIASVKIRHSGKNNTKIQLSIGQSIFNRQCNVNIGKLLSRYGGGGHAGAGGCTIPSDNAESAISEILQVMVDNYPID